MTSLNDLNKASQMREELEKWKWFDFLLICALYLFITFLLICAGIFWLAPKREEIPVFESHKGANWHE